MRGEVVLPDRVDVGAAHLRVEVDDVTLADAPSMRVSATVVHDVEIQPSGRVQFALDVPEVPSGHSLSLRCHIDRSGDGAVAAGDLISTESIPVNPTGPQDPIDVPVDSV